MAIRSPSGGARSRASLADFQTERDFLQQVKDLARLQGWRTFHNHDARRSDPGFPDLICLRGTVGLALELKAKNGRLTPAQVAWLSGFQAAGFEARMVRPADWPEIEELLARG